MFSSACGLRGLAQVLLKFHEVHLPLFKVCSIGICDHTTREERVHGVCNVFGFFQGPVSCMTVHIYIYTYVIVCESRSMGFLLNLMLCRVMTYF